MRDHAIDDLLLQHEVHIFDLVPKLYQSKQERCRYVVGQVAGNTEFGVAPHAQEVKGERVTVMYDEFVVCVEVLTECARKIAINLDRDHSTCAVD